VACSVGDFVDVAGLALVVLAARCTAVVRADPAVVRAFCQQHDDHIVHSSHFILTTMTLTSGLHYTHNYQLSLIDPRDGIMQKTALDDQCDKLAVERRSSEVLST